MNRLRNSLRREDGTTLTELLVGMGIMAVFMAAFTTAIYSMTSASAHTQSVWTTSGQVNTAFSQLDKAIRYASAISKESTTATSGGNWYVEYQTTNTGGAVCTQLQLSTSTKKLNKRTWTVDANGTAGTASGFAPVATNVGLNGSAAPFRLITNNNFAYEQLTISLAASNTASSQTVSSQSTVTFTAENSAAAETAVEASSSASTAVCNQQGRP